MPLKHPMRFVERVAGKKIRVLVNLDTLKFGFMPGRGTRDALVVVRRMQKGYREKEKNLNIRFANIVKGNN